MTSQWFIYACFVIGLTSALVAGVFLAFSDFVMRGLIKATPTSGIESMQAINRPVLRSVFADKLPCIGTRDDCPGIYGSPVAGWRVKDPDPDGAAIYLVTVFLVTMLAMFR